jgi:mycofactocin system transcriptional regulator
VSGRSDQTTRLAVERVALELFAEKGFDNTTVDDVAAAAGISRRTFFRYFASKNDIPWSQFGPLLEDLDAWLSEVDDEVPMLDAIAQAAIRFNRFPSDGPLAHRERMTLIMHTPALLAHASRRWLEWQEVMSKFAARRMGEPIHALGPQLVGHIALAASLAAYEQWLHDERSDLEELMSRTFHMLDIRPELLTRRGAACHSSEASRSSRASGSRLADPKSRA